MLLTSSHTSEENRGTDIVGSRELGNLIKRGIQPEECGGAGWATETYMGKNKILDIANRWRDIWKPGSHPEGDGIKLHTIIEESMKVENVRKTHRDVYKKVRAGQFNLLRNLESTTQEH